MPSAIATRRRPTNIASSLLSRRNPTSVRAAARSASVIAASRAQLQDGAADPDRLAGQDRHRLADPAAADEGPVGRAQILDDPAVAAPGQPGMVGRGEV